MGVATLNQLCGVREYRRRGMVATFLWTLNNCTVTGNSGWETSCYATMTNCIVYFNSDANGSAL